MKNLMRRFLQTAMFGCCFLASLFGAEEKKIVCFGDSLTSCGGKDGRYSDMLQRLSAPTTGRRRPLLAVYYPKDRLLITSLMIFTAPDA